MRDERGGGIIPGERGASCLRRGVRVVHTSLDETSGTFRDELVESEGGDWGNCKVRRAKDGGWGVVREG